MQSPRRSSQAPLKQHFPAFHYRISVFLLPLHFFNQNPPNFLQSMKNISIDIKMPSHRLVFCMKEIFLSGDSPIFCTTQEPPVPASNLSLLQFHPVSFFPPHLPKLNTFPLFLTSQPHHSPTFPKSSYLFHLPKFTTLPSTIKALQNNNIQSSLSTLVFKRRLTISELKSKILILSSREMISDHWI